MKQLEDMVPGMGGPVTVAMQAAKELEEATAALRAACPDEETYLYCLVLADKAAMREPNMVAVTAIERMTRRVVQLGARWVPLQDEDIDTPPHLFYEEAKSYAYRLHGAEQASAIEPGLTRFEASAVCSARTEANCLRPSRASWHIRRLIDIIDRLTGRT